MEELVTQITSYLRGMWRYRWWGMALAWIVGVVAGLVIYQMPDKYESSARGLGRKPGNAASDLPQVGCVVGLDEIVRKTNMTALQGNLADLDR